MAKLGFTTSFDDLDEFAALVFSEIDGELDSLQEAERKRAASKAKRKRAKGLLNRTKRTLRATPE